MNSPRVSIIIPAFNAAGVIAETLESVRNQTFTDFEVLIIDDGSSDNTCIVAKSFCDADPRFRLIPCRHTGLPTTRNTGIAQAGGEWIAFLDADDIWLPEKIARQMELVAARPEVDFTFTNYHFWDGTRDLRTRSYSEGMSAKDEVLPRLIERCSYAISTVMVRSDLLQLVGLFDTTLPSCEDWDLWLRMAENGMLVAGIKEPLVRYRRWPGNMTKNRLVMAESKIAVLEKNLRQTRHPELRPIYQHALTNLKARLELVRACALIHKQPGQVHSLVWRAWQHYP
ncbi:MAG TPA: glycosyltransferase, partial [Verrucomicrobiae bacterium]|nr:glycosyltransferase [Verrucomicrobiae bacterium]